MKKLILPFFLSIFLLFIFISPAQAINLNGEWVADKGAKGKLSQSGDTFSLVVTYSRFEKLIGTTAVKGTITGDTFIGQIYAYTDECPNLNRFVPAKGTISEEKIEIKFNYSTYYPDTCARIPNAEPEGSITYTRISTPSPPFTEKPQISPQSEQTNLIEQQAEQQTQQSKSSNDTNPAQTLNDWITDTFGFFDPYEIKTIPTLSDQATYRDPKITGKNEAELSDNSKNTKKESLYSVGFINSYAGVDSLVKYPGSNEYVPLGMGEIPSGSTIKTEGNSIGIFVGTKGIVYVSADTEVTITHEGLDKIIENSTTRVNKFYLHEGELEVKTIQVNDKESVKEDIVIVTDLVDLIAHSHFWVSHDKSKSLSTVGVYEGEVEVKTKDGQITTVSPKGDRPGVVMVSQKLSVIKLALAGLVLSAVIVGTVFFLKRRGYKTSRSKNKR